MTWSRRVLSGSSQRVRLITMFSYSFITHPSAEETEEHIPDVDDTDGLDLTAEFEHGDFVNLDVLSVTRKK